MSDKEQERLADELDQHIEQLRMRRSARPPDNLTSQLEPIYGMATFFHAASSSAADPSPEFGAQLYQRLRAQMQAPNQRQLPFPLHADSAGLPGNPQSANSLDADQDKTEPVGTGSGQSPIPFQNQKQFRSIYKNNQVPQPVPLPSTSPKDTDVQKQKGRGISRRTLFASGTIAASLVSGVAIGTAIEHSLEPPPATADLHPQIKGAVWYTVAPVDQLGQDPIRFTAETITGYVIRQPENSTEPIIAFSAACTHLGCIVQWQGNTRHFPCPCHGRTFDVTGDPVYKEESQPHYVSLPRLETKVEDGQIYVKIPRIVTQPV